MKTKFSWLYYHLYIFLEHAYGDAIRTARFPRYMSNAFALFFRILANVRCIVGISILRCRPIFLSQSVAWVGAVSNMRDNIIFCYFLYCHMYSRYYSTRGSNHQTISYNSVKVSPVLKEYFIVIYEFNSEHTLYK